MKKLFKSQKGQSLIELLVTIGLAAVLLPALLTGFVASRSGRAQQEQRLQAIALVKEGQEAVRAVREYNWDTFKLDSGGSLFHPEISGSVWTLKSGTDSTNGITRQIVISDVCRDLTTGVILPSVSTCTGSDPDNDISTKKVTVQAYWGGSTCSATSCITTSEYLTRNTNQSYTDSPGVTLDKGAALGDWCKPNPGLATPVKLPGNHQSSSAINEAAIYSGGKGHNYTTSGADAKGDSMDSVDVTDPTPPALPSASPGISYNASKGNKKTYGIYVDPSTNLAYIAFDHSSGATVIVVNVLTGVTVASYSDSSNGNGQSVYYSSGYIYVTDGSTLHAINTSTLKDFSIALDGNGLKVVVVQPFAYVVTDNKTKQLDIVNVNDPTKMTKTSFNLGNNAAGVDLSVDSAGANVAIVTTNVTPQKDIFLYNIALKSVTKSYDSIGMSPNGVALTPEGILIAVGSGGQQYQVFDTTGANPLCPTGLTNPNGASSVDSVSYLKEPDGDVFAYIVTSGGNSKYFQIIAGGPGGGGTFISPKTYQSPTIPVPFLNHKVAFNYFSVVATTNPPTTNITYKIAIKDGGGTCTGVSFVDGDFVSFIPGPLTLGTIGTYVNPGECLQYRATLTTADSSQAPTLTSVTFNYSP